VTAFSHINAVNMQRSELACYNYRRRWRYVTHPFLSYLPLD